MAASTDLSKEAQRAVEVLSETTKSVYYVYDADFRGLEELSNAGSGKELAESLEFLLCNPPTM